MSGSVLVALLGVLAWAGLASGQGAVSEVFYTSDADFDKGTSVNVNHSPPNNDQLQLNAETSTFPFIWVSLSRRCTIAKIDTRNGTILGEYRTISDDVGCSESSRTTVGLDGSAWVGHRGSGGATHVGLVEANQCIDRNGNGTIDTSSAYGDVKAWAGDDSVVANAADECIIHHVDTDSEGIDFSDTRHMSIDASNNLWIGTFGGSRFIRVNGSTGAIETAVRDFECGGYGGLIDGNGVLWSAQGAGFGLLRWDPNAPDSATNPRCVPVNTYGLAVDPNGFIWTTTFGTEVYKISPDGNTILGPFTHGASNAQGLASTANGDIWVSSSLNCSSDCTIGHLKNDGTFVGNVPNPTGAGSTGVAVDAAGKVWTANRSSHTATRIDPNDGELDPDTNTRVGKVDLTVEFPAGPDGRPLPSPYNYSDMTGNQLLTSTAPQGTWTVVQDGGAAGTRWGKIVWNTEARGSQPPGTEILFEVRAADTQAGLGGQQFVQVSNGAPFSVTGRFIEVRVTLRPDAQGNGPVLSDLRVCAEGSSCQAEAAAPTPTPPASQRARRPRARVAGVPSRCTRSNFRTRVRVRAAAGVRSVRVTLNGRRLVSTRRSNFAVRVPARRLRAGRHRLTVVVRDRNGRRARISRTFRRCPRAAQQRRPVFTG